MDETTDPPVRGDIWEAHLASWAARDSTSRGRVHDESEHPYRSIYQRDRDRIIHSTAFRRLEYKTQVFVNHEGDHYRTRLTHTLEVAQIGRTLARALHLNEDLTEAIALAHDLGHTPFGHSGEEALNGLMADFGGFEHNAQGLRVVDHLESRYPDFPGLNLSYEVREGFASHSTRHDFPRAREGFPEDERPPLEAQLVEVADEIAYDNHDLDDGLSSGLLDEGEVRNLAIWRRAMTPEAEGLPRRLRWSQTIRRLINLEATDVIEESRRRIADAGVESLADVRRHPDRLIGTGPELSAMKDELETFLQARLYNHYAVRRMANKAQRFLREVFELYANDPHMLPGRMRDEIVRWGLKRTVADYIAGMTDRFAQEEYQRLFHPFERM